MAEQKRVLWTFPSVAWALLMASFVALACVAFWFRETILTDIRNQSYTVLLDQARGADWRGDTDAALSLFEKLTDAYPSKEEGLLAYAEYLASHGDEGQSDVMYARAVNVGPQRFGSVSKYAYFLDRTGQQDRAIDMCRTYLSVHPDDLWAQYELGLRLAWKGKWEECEPCLLKAAAVPALFGRAKSKLGEAYAARGMNTEALRTWAEAVEFGSALENKQLLYDMAAVRRKLGDTEGAAVLLERHLGCFPRSLWAATELRSVYEQLGNVTARDRLDLVIGSMTPAVATNAEIAPFTKVRGVTPDDAPLTMGASASLDVYFEFFSTLTPTESPEVRFWISPGRLGERSVYTLLSSHLKRLGAPPFWRGDCLMQTFALTMPQVIDAGVYHLALGVSPDFKPRVDLCEITIVEAPDAPPVDLPVDAP
jgi:tetratricopeptide (TPR) repeat protein